MTRRLTNLLQPPWVLAMLLVGLCASACTPRCPDCPAMIISLPKLTGFNASEGALALDFSLADKNTQILISETEATITRVEPNWQIEPRRQGGNDVKITAPAATPVEQEGSTAYRVEFFRLFLPLQSSQLQALTTRGLKATIFALGPKTSIYDLTTKATRTVDTTQLSFQVVGRLWVGKLPDRLICFDAVGPATLTFLLERETQYLLLWLGNCPS